MILLLIRDKKTVSKFVSNDAVEIFKFVDLMNVDIMKGEKFTENLQFVIFSDETSASNYSQNLIHTNERV